MVMEPKVITRPRGRAISRVITNICRFSQEPPTRESRTSDIRHLADNVLLGRRRFHAAASPASGRKGAEYVVNCGIVYLMRESVRP